MLLQNQFFKPDSLSHSQYRYNFRVEDHFIPSQGEKIHSQLLHHTGEYKGLIIHFHGNANNITSHITHIDWLPEYGYDVLIFDYAGYGQSSGKPSFKTVVQNGIDVLAYAEKNREKQSKLTPISIIGQSLGASIACAALARSNTPVDNLVLDAAFSSCRQMVKHTLQTTSNNKLINTLIPLLISTDYDIRRNIHNIRAKTLLIHGTQDKITPYFFAKEIQKICDCELWSFETGHAETFRKFDTGFRQKLTSWLHRKDERISEEVVA